jgi:hypothetical protein
LAVEFNANDVVLGLLNPDMTPLQKTSARAAQLVRQGSLKKSASKSTDEYGYMSADKLASAIEGISEKTRQAMVKAKIDTDVAKHIDDDGLKEAGIESSLERARVKAWLQRKGYLRA